VINNASYKTGSQKYLTFFRFYVPFLLSGILSPQTAAHAIQYTLPNISSPQYAWTDNQGKSATGQVNFQGCQFTWDGAAITGGGCTTVSDFSVPQAWTLNGATLTSSGHVRFTGPDKIWGPPAPSTATYLDISLNFSLPITDPGGTQSLTSNDFGFKAFSAVCFKYQDQGNDKCRRGETGVFVPSPISFLAFAPLATLLRIRSRYKMNT
jgi:hypothetical protein